MNYSAMIQNRRSVHAFREKEVPSEAIGQLRSYYEKTCPRLVPEIATELIVLDKDAQPALESSAGYNQFLIGAPHYLLLMSAPHSYAAINAGYMMEDLVLKLTELDIDTCWMTFTDSDKIKKALSLATPLEVAAIVAFGYGEKTAKKLRLNILSMSQIDVRAEQQYYAPKKGVHDLVHMGSWSNKSGLDEMMDFYDDIRHQFPGNIGKLLADTLPADAVGLAQHFRNRLFQVVIVLPHLRVTGIAAHPGVRHIENVVQARESAGFVQQCNALGTPAHIAVHPVAPNVKFGAGGGIRALGVDHQLVCKGVLVQPRCGGQVVRPAFPVSGQAVGRALGKGEIFFGFA